MILSNRDIEEYLKSGELVIEPRTEETVRENGVDLRIGSEVCELASAMPLHAGKEYREDELRGFYYKCIRGDEFTIRPLGRYLLTTLEYVRLPPNVMAFVNQRSSVARLGLFIPPTIVDAGFEGELTIELIGGGFPVVLRKGMRFLHLVFAEMKTPTDKPYSGKYLGQRGVKLPKLPIS